jgi:hypothetical protein
VAAVVGKEIRKMGKKEGRSGNLVYIGIDLALYPFRSFFILLEGF